jgi:hypothetical protein
MFRRTSPQRSLFSVENQMADEKRRRLEKSWAHVFRRKAIPLIDEDRFAKYFCVDNGRPNKSIRLIVGVLALKEVFDLTDEEALEQLEFNAAWQYALDVLPEDAHTCQKTLHNTRERLLGDDEGAGLFESTTASLISISSLKTGRQRQDSTHIVSNIRLLTRLGLFVQTITMFLRQLRDEHPRIYADVAEEMSERYLEREGYFADARASEARRRVEQSALDVYWLVTRFGENRSVKTMESFQLVERLYREQCVPPSTDIPEAIELREVPSSSSLQTPTDPDATYGFKGKGYSAQIAETCDPENEFQVVTAVEVHGANEGDQQHVESMLDQIAETCGAPPEMLQADAGYASGENFVAASERGTELLAPVGAPASKTYLPIYRFAFDETGERILSCPNGEAPFRHDPSRDGNATVASWKSSQCKRCPLRDECPTDKRIGRRVLRFGAPDVAVARRRAEQETPTFKEQHKLRSGIEATHSELKRAHGLRKLRVRGAPRVRLAVRLKMLGLNLKRLITAAIRSAASDTPPVVAECAA